MCQGRPRPRPFKPDMEREFLQNAVYINLRQVCVRLRVEGLAQFSRSFFATSPSGFAVLGFRVSQNPESELEILIKGAVYFFILWSFAKIQNFVLSKLFFDWRRLAINSFAALAQL